MLRGIEQRVESLVEGVFGRAFRSHVQPVEVARKLVKEMDDHKSVSVSRVYVPNEYAVYLSPRDRDQFRAYEQSLATELADYLAEHARREGYVLLSPPQVVLHEDADLAIGEFGIATRTVHAPAAQAPVEAPREVARPPVAAPEQELSATRVFATPATPAPAPTPEPEPPSPVLVVNGARHELTRTVTTIGRAKDCDLPLDDVSVSRRHAEIRLDQGGAWIVDLDSTNGTEVNGSRIDRARLHAGDRLTLGQTELLVERAP